MKKVLILGAGYAGSIIANKLAREFRNKIARDELEVTILDKSDISINQGGFTFLPFDLYAPEDIMRPRKKLISPRVKSYFGADGEVVSLDLASQEVSVKSGKKYNYDHLVIAMGCSTAVDAVPGLSNDLHSFYTSMDDALKLREVVKNLKSGKVVVSVASMPVPCPGAPVKFTFMLDSYLRNIKKIRDDVQLTLVWPIEPIGPPEFNKFISGQFREKNVEVIRNFPLAAVDANKKEISSKNGDKISYDLLISVPPHKVPKILVSSKLTDEKGWLPADKATLQYRGPAGNYDNVYVLGDIGPADILKTGLGAHYQAIAVSQNLINDILGNGMKVSYMGETGCPMITELETPSTHGKGYIATWKYGEFPAPFVTTKLGWFMYRMYYHMHWDLSVKGLF